MKKRILFSFLVCLILRGELCAQQLPYISFYRSNWGFINPGAFAEDFVELPDMYLLTTINTRPFKKLEGAPRYGDLRLEWVFNKDAWAWKITGAGIYDEAGAIKDSKANLGFAAAIPVGNMGYFTIGGSADYINQHINTKAVTWQSPTSIPEPFNNNFLNFNVGGFCYFNAFLEKKGQGFIKKVETESESDYYGYLGFSCSQIANVGNTTYSKRNPQLNLIAGGVIGHFEPSFWFRKIPDITYQTFASNLPLSIDFNLRYVHKYWNKNTYNRKLYGNKLWIGFGVSTASTINFEVGGRFWDESFLKVNQKAKYFQISFAYTCLQFNQSIRQKPTDFEINLAWNIAKF